MLMFDMLSVMCGPGAASQLSPSPPPRIQHRYLVSQRKQTFNSGFYLGGKSKNIPERLSIISRSGYQLSFGVNKYNKIRIQRKIKTEHSELRGVWDFLKIQQHQRASRTGCKNCPQK